MIHLGTDIVEVDRIDGLIARWSGRFVQRIFTPDEIAYCQRQASPTVHYAGRFAAKEAVRKALHSAGRRTTVPFQHIEVVRNDIGVPQIRIADEPDRHVSLSISHTDRIAIAIVAIDADG
jgi:holo-[acyl-carrier protein] synthase